jgi:hypothetical protein
MEFYAQRCIKKRVQKMYKSDLGGSLFSEGIFYWNKFRKEENDSSGHLFKLQLIYKT